MTKITDIPPATKLVSSLPVPKESFTSNQETDVRLALTRGLAEYVSQLSFEAVGGRKLSFKAAFEEWAEPEERAEYPSVVMLVEGPSSYEARSLTPQLDKKERLAAPDNRYLIVQADFVTDVKCEVWCTDPKERSGLLAMLEHAFIPHYHRYGFVLELPHYFNARATYSLTNLILFDGEEDALRRYRRAAFTLNSRVPVIKLFSFPDAVPTFDLQAVGEGADVLVTTEVT